MIKCKFPDMVSTLLLLFLGISVLTSCSISKDSTSTDEVRQDETFSSNVYVEDISRFWSAYDAIQAASDPREKSRLFSEIYLDRGTPGLHAIMRARNYRSEEFLEAIEEYPEFWNSVRADTLRAADYIGPIEDALKKMKLIYPDGEKVPIYFVIGALRTPGTAIDGKLLIGAELAMATPKTPTHELSARLSHLSRFFPNNPKAGLIDTNLHEYVHTQQRSLSGSDLLSQALLEGVAEYVSTEALGRTSKQTSITYGLAHHDAVIAAFEKDILLEDYSGWIWNSTDNQFGTRDLGYYVGYAISKAYVERSENSQRAIKTLIELDYRNPIDVRRIVDQSGVFPKRVEDYQNNEAASE